MSMTQGTLSNLFDEVVTAVGLEAAFDPSQAVGPLLYTQRAATGRRERVATFSDFAEFELKNELAEAESDTILQQFTKTFTPTVLAKKTEFSEEVIRDEDWGFIARLSANFGSAFGQTVEQYMAEPFVGAFTGTANGRTYVGADGLSICNSAHVNAAGGNSQDNSDTQTLNMAGVKTSHIAQRRFKDARGKKNAKVKPSLLLHPPELSESAYEISKSSQRPDDGNNAMNYYAGLTSLEWDELSDTNAWFSIDPEMMRRQENLLWLWHWEYTMFGDGDQFQGKRRLGANYRASHGVVDWLWIYGNNPS